MIPLVNSLSQNQQPNQQNNLSVPRYNRGILAQTGGNPQNTLLGTLYNQWQQHQQNKMDQTLQSGMDQDIATSDPSDGDPTQGNDEAANGGMDSSGGEAMQQMAGPLEGEASEYPAAASDAADLVTDMFSRGAVVTKPTVALLGEHGPEAVMPMEPGSSDKIRGLTDEPIAVPDQLGELRGLDTNIQSHLSLQHATNRSRRIYR